MGSLSVSDLFTAWVDEESQPRFLALETLPDEAATLGAWIELYPDGADTAPPDVRVQMSLVKAGDETPLMQHEATASRSGGKLLAVAELPVKQLEPGAYELRATIVESGTITGNLSASIRKGGQARSTPHPEPGGSGPRPAGAPAAPRR